MVASNNSIIALPLLLLSLLLWCCCITLWSNNCCQLVAAFAIVVMVTTCLPFWHWYQCHFCFCLLPSLSPLLIVAADVQQDYVHCCNRKWHCLLHCCQCICQCSCCWFIVDSLNLFLSTLACLSSLLCSNSCCQCCCPSLWLELL